MTDFQTLRAEAAVLADINAALGLMSWDLEVNMAPGSGERRAAQMATLAGLRHSRLLEKLKPLTERVLAGVSTLTPEEQLNVRQLWKAVEKATKLPTEFVEAMTRATSAAQPAWEHAKRTADFSHFRPHLEKLVALQQQEANYYGYAAHPYDALLDNYEPEATCVLLDGVFNPLRAPLRKLIDQVAAARQVDDALIRQRVSEQDQWNFSLKVLRALGFNFDRGRQDRSTHPFSTSFGMEDVRITTRLDEHDIQDMLYSTIHECGHALYEQGLPPEWYGMPGAEACSLSIHESQSRIWENNVARSLAFCQYWFEDFRQLFPDRLAGKSVEDLYRAVNKVQPNLIRISSDELTYHQHIILRYELERDMIAGQLKVADLPDAWNAKVKEYLGLDVPDAAKGVLQDVHWSHGSFGYFPTYSLGSFYAAQFYNAALKANPGMEKSFAAGDFSSLNHWLKQHIWDKGRLYNSEQLCQQATGEGLNPEHFLRYIRTKLETVYATALPA